MRADNSNDENDHDDNDHVDDALSGARRGEGGGGGREGTGRSAREPKRRGRRVLLHRPGYKSPGYKRVHLPRPSVRHCCVTFAPARPASDRQWNEGTKNSPPVALALSRLLSSTRNTSSGRHEVADPDDRRDGRPRHAFIVELRTPRATAARSLAPSSPSRVDLSPSGPLSFCSP